MTKDVLSGCPIFTHIAYSFDELPYFDVFPFDAFTQHEMHSLILSRCRACVHEVTLLNETVHWGMKAAVECHLPQSLLPHIPV